MPISRKEKESIVQDLKDDLDGVSAMFVSEFSGVGVDSLTELRSRARADGVKLKVIKNTLMRLVLEGSVFSALSEFARGSNIYSYSSDPVGAARIIYEFSRSNPSVRIKGGFYAGSLLSDQDVKELAMIPSRDELLSRLLFVMKEPLVSVARGISALIDVKKEV